MYVLVDIYLCHLHALFKSVVVNATLLGRFLIVYTSSYEKQQVFLSIELLEK